MQLRLQLQRLFMPTTHRNHLEACKGWVLMHAGLGCRKAGPYYKQEGQEATASHDVGQAKAEPADDNPAHASSQV